MTRYEKISCTIGVLACVMSFVSLFFTSINIYWTNNLANKLHEDRMKFDERLRRSNVVVQLGRDYEQDLIIFTELTGVPRYSALFKQKYNVTLNNIGFQTASIVDWSVVGSFLIENDLQEKRAYGGYSGMGPWFYEINGVEAALPFSIEPNKPKSFVLEIGTLIPSEAWKSLAGYLQFDKVYGYDEAESVFSKHGYSYFGQYAITEISDYSSFEIRSYGADEYFQDFIFYLQKGNGEQVEAVFKPVCQ